jgi:RNA polymerase sigma-70 factor (ECF subfamily)
MTPFFGQSARSARAFDRLYRRHVGDVYRYALALLDDPADAEAVTQTTFLNAHRALEHGTRPGKPRSWLLGIAHTVCRRRARHAPRADHLAESLVPDGPGLRAEDVQRALGHLPFHERAALIMRELEGRSCPEIAELLELSLGAVETLIFRARRALREQLEDALTCEGAELAISRQLDGRLDRLQKGALRAHLRQCGRCVAFAYHQNAQREALRSLATVPVPAGLATLFGGPGSHLGDPRIAAID